MYYVMPPDSITSIGRYLCVTTLGAYMCVSDHVQGEERKLLFWLLSQDRSPEVDIELLDAMAVEAGIKEPRQCLDALLKRHLLTLSDTRCIRATGAMQEILPRLLAALSDGGPGLLADSGGLCLASTGFEESDVEALTALASKMLAALEHADQKVFDLLGIEYGLPCLYDLKQRRVVIFATLDFGSSHFVLVTQGKAMFLGTAFRDLVWALWGRYGTDLIQ